MKKCVTDIELLKDSNTPSMKNWFFTMLTGVRKFIPFSSDVDFSLVPSASSAVESLQNKTEFYPLFKELCLSF